MRFTSMRFDGLSTIEFKVLGASQADPYVIKDVKGLGPTEVDVAISTSAHSAGRYSSAFANPREIVITLTLNPNWKTNKTVDQLREDLYWMAENEYSRGVLITLVDDARDVCNVTGYVSRMEPSLFSEKTDLVITFKCLDSKLTGPETITHESPNSVLYVTPVGTARTMPRIYIDFLKPSFSLSVVRSINGKWEEPFELKGFLYQPGDRITLGSLDDRKQVLWTRYLATNINHIRYMSLASKWPQLDPGGVNVLIAWGSDYLQDDVRIVQAAYRPKYRGV